MISKISTLIFTSLILGIVLLVSCTNNVDLILENVLIEETITVEDKDTSTTNNNNQGVIEIENSPYGYGFGISTDIEIATWYDFKKAAITHTWDDSNVSQIDIALPIYDSFKYPVTLFTLPSNVNDWEAYKAAHNNGHEIASHTLTHKSFSDLAEKQIQEELFNSKSDIESSMGFKDCLTLAYPYCANESYGLTQKYYIAARTCKNSIERSTPDDFMDIGAVLCGSGTNYATSDDFNKFAELAIESNGWGVYLFHEIDGTGGNSITSENLNKHLSFLQDSKDIFWVETFLNVVKYIKERNSAKITIVNTAPNRISLDLTDDLVDNIYNQPLTIKKELPLDWNVNNVKIQQSGSQVSHRIVQIETKNFVIFEALPDNGIIEIQGN